MKKATIIAVAIATGIGTAAFIPPAKRAAALDIDQVVDTIYEQLVTEKKNKAFATLDNAYIEPEEIQRRLFAIDNENNLYDGAALKIRGQFHTSTSEFIGKKGQDEYIEKTEYHIEIKNAYDVDEADAITDNIAREIEAKAGEGADLKEKFYILCSYIGDNFEYDYDLKAKIEDYNEAIRDTDTVTLEQLSFTEVIKTGYGKMVCSGFANLTYLTANKLGIDCKIADGKEHAYNLVRFDNDSPYKICDLTTGRYGLLNEATLEANKEIYDPTLSYGYSETQKVYTRETSSKADIYPQIGYYLFHGYGLSPDREEALLIFVDYLLNPIIVIVLAIAAIVFIASSIRRAHKRHLRRIRRKEGELK